jgi:Ca2+-binding RTX toxin-like protein
MTMLTTLEYMQLALGVYAASDKNYIDPPTGWTLTDWQPDKSSGFSAGCYVNGTEMVISYTGTNDSADMANWSIGFGLPFRQVFDAVDYYFACVAAHPEATSITFAGHSLGGGLASLMAVYFNKPATVFDEAPFQIAAVNPLVTDAVGVYMIANGYLDGAFTYYLLTGGGAALTRESNVTHYYIDGEALNYPRYSWDTLVGNEYVFSMGDSTAGSVERHSMALMAAIQYSNEYPNLFHDVVKKLPDLVTQLLDTNLFAAESIHPNKEDLLRRLLRHQIGIYDPATGTAIIAPDEMLKRFASDMNKLAQDGGLTMSDLNGQPNNYNTWNNVSKALTAFAMQFYYEDTANATNANKELFTQITGGIQFDMTEVSKDFAASLAQGGDLSQVKGYQYFQDYLNGTSSFTLQERGLIKAMLPVLRDWYVQAGASGMNATDTLNRGAFMLGGTGADALVGGAGNDLLVGNAGDDLLQGGKGNDVLLGGAGNDAYVYSNGAGGNQDGLDIILDFGRDGAIYIDGTQVAGGTEYGDSRVHKDADGRLYVQSGNNLIINGNILVQGWQAGDLGINMTGPAAETDITTTRDIYGDLASDGTPDDLGNPDGTASPDRADTLYDSAGNDHIMSYGGKDLIFATRGGADLIESGAGRDAVFAYGGDDLVIGGADGDVLAGGQGNDRIYADTQMSVAAAIVAGNVDGSGLNLQGDWLAGGEGNDTLIGSTARDVLSGGNGTDLLISGAGDDDIIGDTDWVTSSFDWTVTQTKTAHRYFFPIEKLSYPTTGAADVIYAGEGNDHVIGEFGNDVIFGEGGDDHLWGDGDYYGLANGNDYLDGGKGDDILVGGGGVDIYVYNIGDGKDLIIDNTADKNILRFGAGITSDQITLSLGSLTLDLMLDLGNGDEIHIDGFNQNDVFNSSSISSFEFDDGTNRWRTRAATINSKAANDEAHAWRNAA